MPRWYGKPGEWEQFAADSANKLGGDEGEVLYARIIWFLHDKKVFHNIFAESTVKWERVKRSFEALLKRYPDSLSVINEFARISCDAADWKNARDLFERINGRADAGVWASRELFLKYRKEAFAHQ